VKYTNVPVRPRLRFGFRPPVAQWLDGEEIRGGGELRIGELGAVEIGGCGEGVYEYERWFSGVVGLGHLISNLYAAEVGDVDCFDVGHGLWRF
jgi:hypothetical protein